MSALKTCRSAALFAAIIISSAVGTASAEPLPKMTPLVGEVLTAPRPVKGSDGRTHLVYELHLSNVTDQKANVKRISIFGDRSTKPLAVLESDAVGERLSLGGRRGSETRELGAFQFGVAFLHVALEPGQPLPTVLRHEVAGFFQRFDADMSMSFAETPVISPPPLVLGPPLRGDGYLAGDGCCDSFRHVRALLPLNGTFHLAQRFAIDWEKIDGEHRLFDGDAKDVRSYHIYGQPILAVADGTIVDARADLHDQVPGALPPGLPIEEADGNFAILDVGDGRFVLYAHMRPGSLKVRSGDIVRRGDVIGEVGNTGNSSAPHLHLQAMDGPSGLLSNGLPYVFDAFSITAVDEAGTADFDRAEETGTPLTLTPTLPPLRLDKALPLDLTVVDWGNR